MHAISDDEGNDSPQQSGGAQVREWDEWQPDTALGADSDDADDANTRKRKSEQRVINNQVRAGFWYPAPPVAWRQHRGSCERSL